MDLICFRTLKAAEVVFPDCPDCKSLYFVTETSGRATDGGKPGDSTVLGNLLQNIQQFSEYVKICFEFPLLNKGWGQLKILVVLSTKTGGEGGDPANY